MTEREICLSYRQAKRPYEQIEILAELNGVSRAEIIRILYDNGIQISERAVKWLRKQESVLEHRVEVGERRYREDAKELRRYKGRAARIRSNSLEALEAQIKANEKEYREIVRILESIDRQGVGR